MMENTHLRNLICFSFLTACQNSRSLKFVFYFILHNSLDSRKIVYFGNVSSEFTGFFWFMENCEFTEHFEFAYYYKLTEYFEFTEFCESAEYFVFTDHFEFTECYEFMKKIEFRTFRNFWFKV